MDLITTQLLYLKFIFPYLLVIIFVISYYVFFKKLKKNKNYVILFISFIFSLVYFYVNSTPEECGYDPISEACVWGKSFAPLTIGVKVFIALPMFFLFFTFIISLWKKLQKECITR